MNPEQMTPEQLAMLQAILRQSPHLQQMQIGPQTGIPGASGEMRSTNTPMGDAAAQAVGPAVGPMVSGIDRGIQTANRVKDEYVIPAITGSGMMQDAVSNMGEAVQQGDVVRGAGAVGEGALAALPFARGAFGTLPRTMAAALGYGTMPAIAGGALSIDQAQAQTRAEKRQQRELDAQAGRDEKARGAQALREEASKDAAARRELESERARNEEAARVKAEEKRLEEEQAQKEADTPFKKLYPKTSLAIGAAGTIGAAALTSALTRGRVKNFNQAREQIEEGWQKAVQTAQANKPSSLAHQRAMDEAAEWQRAAEKLGTKGPSSFGPVVSGTAVGELGVAAPDLADAVRAPRGSKLREQVKEANSDWREWVTRIGLGAAAGYVPAKSAAALAKRGVVPQRGYGPETEALLNALSNQAARAAR